MNKKYAILGVVYLVLCAICLLIGYWPKDYSDPVQPLFTDPPDFVELRSVNPDIDAWLQIPGTPISFPVLQREGDDSFYLSHNSAGEKSKAGAIFTESSNSRDFSDPLTVVYGHRMNSGDRFGQLESLFDEAGFDANQSITLYLPDEVRNYEIFGAVTYSNSHILSENSDFLREIRSAPGLFREESFPEAGDRIIVLSTCTGWRDSQRFLVLAKCSPIQ